MGRYEVYVGDELMMKIEAEGHVTDIGLSDTLSLYGVAPEIEAKINSYVAPSIRPENGKKLRLYKIFAGKPDIK